MIPVDVEPRGVARYTAIIRSFRPGRPEWSARYRLGPHGFAARSRIAADAVRRHRHSIDAVLQIGATFDTGALGALPLFLYCDSNMALAMRGASSGYSDAVHVSAAEASRIRARESAVYARAACIFTMSDVVRTTFVDDFRVAEECTRTVYGGPNGFDFDTAHSTERQSGPPTVLFVGRQFERKGGPLLLRAFEKVRQAVPDARLIIAGPPELSEPVGAGVEFLGFLDKDTEAGRRTIAEMYASANVFCMPTRFEPFGLVFVEAMHYGLACVGPASWAVPEIIDHGHSGVTIDSDVADEWATALTTLLRDPARADAMGRAGRARAIERFTWERATAKMLDTMRGVAVPAP